jgi:hypothetical protein
VDLLTAIQLSALEAVERPTHEACWRRVARAYSKKFHTPLHMVDELPDEVVLQAFYEDMYSEMDPKERDAEVEALLETDEQRKERATKKDADLASVSSLLEDAALLEAIKVVGGKKSPPKTGAPPKVDATPGVDGAPSKSMLSQMRDVPPDIAMFFGE